MFSWSVSLTATLVAANVYAQGSFLFGNRPSAIGGAGAPVGYLGDPRPGSPLGGAVASVSGPNWLAQLVVAGVPRPDTIVPFGTGAAAGFIPNTAVVLDGILPGQTVSMQLAAWHASLGPDYATAWALGIAGAGLSNPVNVTLKQPTDPTLNPMVGLQGFSIPTIIPEPLAASLLLVGGILIRMSGHRRSMPAA